MAKRRKKKQKAKELTEQNIIDIDARREERRLKLRAEAEAERARRGEKSIMQEMMDDMARGDERFETREEDEAVKRSKKRREKKKKGAMSAQKKIAILVIIVVVGALIFSVGKIVKLKIQQNEAEHKLEELEAEKADLEKQVNQIGTDSYMEKQAREWLKMAKQGEIIYVYDDDENTKQEDTTKQDDTKQNE